MEDNQSCLAGMFNKLSELIDITIQDIEIENLENKLNGLIIAQISDLHIHQWNVSLIEHTVEVLNKINPDIVTITGDVICYGKKFIPNLSKIFQEINTRYGKFACLGNHDHSDGDDGIRIQQLYKKSDFQVLVNESARLNIEGNTLYIAGADDVELGDQNIPKMVQSIQKDATSIFLTHNPFNFKQFADYNPALVLAGHTHGGQLYFQIFDFIYKMILKSSYVAGLYELGKSHLYVNRGIGTALITKNVFGNSLVINTPRINTKPEISLFRLTPKAFLKS